VTYQLDVDFQLLFKVLNKTNEFVKAAEDFFIEGFDKDANPRADSWHQKDALFPLNRIVKAAIICLFL
jgi:hypothetical protein